MQINITARHLDLTQPLADYVRKKVEKCDRLLDNIMWAHVILSVQKQTQEAEIVIHAANKHTFDARERAVDLYAAIDLAVEKMEVQLRKHKEKLKVHKKENAKAASLKTGLTTGRVGKKARTLSPAGPESDYIVSEVKRFDVKPVSLAEAIVEMEAMGYNFYMFLNAETSHVNVVYKRDNGTFGILEPEM